MIENTDFSKSEQYTLSIRLSTDGFSFSITDESATEIIFHTWKTNETLSLNANLKQAFLDLEWLKRPFKRVNVIMASKRFTLVPLEYFEDELTETFFYHNLPEKENETVKYNILHRSNVVVLFGMDKSARNYLREQYDNLKFYSQVTPFMEHVTTLNRTAHNSKIYIHLRNKALDTLAYQGSKLLLANSFDCRNISDYLYYILYLWKQLSFDQEKDELCLTGSVAGKEQLVAELKKFIEKVSYLEPTSDLDLKTIVTCE